MKLDGKNAEVREVGRQDAHSGRYDSWTWLQVLVLVLFFFFFLTCLPACLLKRPLGSLAWHGQDKSTRARPLKKKWPLQTLLKGWLKAEWTLSCSCLLAHLAHVRPVLAGEAACSNTRIWTLYAGRTVVFCLREDTEVCLGRNVQLEPFMLPCERWQFTAEAPLKEKPPEKKSLLDCRWPSFVDFLFFCVWCVCFLLCNFSYSLPSVCRLVGDIGPLIQL